MTEPTSPAAVLLDRDGVINRRIRGGYVTLPEELEILPGALEGLRRLDAAGHPLVIVTNQSGIGRGLMTEADLERVHDRLRARVAEAGAHLLSIHHCPHHPGDGCRCRKPGPGLIEQAARAHGLDLGRAFLVGDHASDIEAARAAGVGTAVLAPSAESDAPPPGAPRPDHVVEGGLLAAVIWILERAGASH